jgi:hypothetical protein
MRKRLPITRPRAFPKGAGTGCNQRTERRLRRAIPIAPRPRSAAAPGVGITSGEPTSVGATAEPNELEFSSNLHPVMSTADEPLLVTSQKSAAYGRCRSRSGAPPRR